MTSIVKDLPPTPPIDGPSSPSEPPPPKPIGLFKRLTTRSKPRKPSESWGGDQPSPDDGVPRHRRRRTSPSGGRAHTTPVLENAWTSPEQRAAALRERGLLPSQARPFRDAHGYKLPLSEQEAQLDDRVAVTVDVPAAIPEQESEAGRIAEEWMKKNMGEGYSARSRSKEREPAQPQIRVEPVTAPVSNPLPVPPRKDSARPAFLEREPQASKLLDAMKNYQPQSRPTTGRRYPKDSSSTDSDSD
ncbi:hypothetical protein EIP86_000747 [Pleurotus ostreatoroseus]|nr:hypothetical protein EIP86_000747 [Pleurotus ostreatoroseus]